MQHNLYSIHDVKAGYFLPAWPCRNHGIARREFAEAVKNPQLPFNQFPADYVLYYVGDFDDDSAKFTGVQPPHRLCDGVEILQMAAASRPQEEKTDGIEK